MTGKKFTGQTHSSRGTTYFGLRIDVDTIRGLTQGVPQALDILNEVGMHGTFFVTTGPDRTGRNLFHLHQRKNSVLKRNPYRRYGLKEILYGLLLPAPLMEAQSDIIKEIVRKGHEVGLHGYDHYRWTNYFHQMAEEEIEHNLMKGIHILTRILGKRPVGFASPSFKWSPNSLIIQSKWNFMYSSDMYGTTAFYPQFDKKPLKMLQIPVSQPSIEELVLAGIPDSKIVDFFVKNLQNKTLVTVYVHAGYEFIFKTHILRAVLSKMQHFEYVTTFKFAKLAEELSKSAKIRKIT